VLKAIGTDVLKGSVAQLILQDFLNLFLKTVDVLSLKELRVKTCYAPQIKTYKRWKLLLES
jgi:hypothetical protein